jgi:hypothetical protein
MVEATKHENKMMANGINKQYEHNQLQNWRTLCTSTKETSKIGNLLFQV